LYVGGLLKSVVKDDLLHELEKYGEVVDVWIARNPPGFAFVEYVKSQDAEKAVRALDGVTICGSRVRVEFAHGRSREAPGFRGGRPRGRGSSRRYDSPRRNGRFSPPPYGGPRYPYDHLASYYHPDVANAAAAAAAAGFPYGMTGPPMLPFLPPEDLLRSLQPRRRSPGRGSSPMYQRGRSPGFRRRSRSPLGPMDRSRGRTPPTTYDGRGPGRRSDPYPRGGFGGRGPREPRNGFSPPPIERSSPLLWFLSCFVQEVSESKPDRNVSPREATKLEEVAPANPISRSCLTPEGKIWPASVSVYPDMYFCSKIVETETSESQLAHGATLLSESCRYTA
uniref:RRM domain-containing protein n=1 Tax=Echinostoma caproni TaxID=27848 RepID=A0A183ANS8_9TREM